MGRATRNPSFKELIMMGFGYRLYPSYTLPRFKWIAKSRMGRAARNPSFKELIMMGFGYRLYPSYTLPRFKWIAKSRMGRAARNPSFKESIMMGFGYRLYPSYVQPWGGGLFIASYLNPLFQRGGLNNQKLMTGIDF